MEYNKLNLLAYSDRYYDHVSCKFMRRRIADSRPNYMCSI